MLKATAATVHRARKLRKEMSLPERLLWRELRKRPADLKFRKQHPAGKAVLDFFCAEATLCIEIDGAHHDRGDQPAYDDDRDAWLAHNGIATLRIAATDVLADLDAALTHIVATASARLNLHHPPAAGGPPPRTGEALKDTP